MSMTQNDSFDINGPCVTLLNNDNRLVSVANALVLPGFL